MKNSGIVAFSGIPACNPVAKDKSHSVMSANNSVTFQGESQTKESEEGKKNKLSFKKMTNILGVAAWLAIVGTGIYKTGFLRPRSAENIAKKAKDDAKIIKKKIENSKNSDKELDKLLEGKTGVNKFFTKKLYKIGKWSKETKDKLGSELYNNFTYAFGTLVVMPLVIWTSPFGKKDSTTGDKVYATMRQPFSVASSLAMQYTFDKLIDKYVPKAIKKNKLESDEIKQGTENGKIKPALFDKIKYNYDEATRIFKDELPNISDTEGGLKGIITKEQAEEILNIPGGSEAAQDIESVKSHHDTLLKGLKDKSLLNADELEEFSSRFKSFKDAKLNPEQLAKLEKKLKTVSNSCGLNTIAKQRLKVVNNVVASSIIGCTFLNVIYGKSMKGFEHMVNKIKDHNKSKEVK